MQLTGFETDVAFTAVYEYTPADLEDLGPEGLINESLKEFFSKKLYYNNGVTYNVKGVTELETKVVPGKYWTSVYLYGTLELAGELAKV